MKKLFGTLVMVALAFSSCKKAETETAEEESAPPSGETAPAPDAPAATPVAKAIPAATPVPELAPAGRYFLRRKVSMETGDGIVGLPPGTPLDQTAPGQYRTLEGVAVAVADSDVTNVMNEARALASSDRAAQAALARTIAPKPTAPTPAARKSGSAPAAAPAATPDNFVRKEQVILQQMERIDTEMSKLKNQDPRTSPTAERLHRERTKLDTDLRILRGQF